jgi:F-type H+-transporting ATPase subunit b
MEQVLSTFGIDWKLLLINTANFGLLMFILWYFLYEPILKMLEERRRKIEQGVADAEAAAKERSSTEAARAATLAQAGKEADEMLLRAREAARHKEDELVAAGEATAETLVAEAHAQAQELKAQALKESKEELAKLVVLGMEKAFHKK